MPAGLHHAHFGDFEFRKFRLYLWGRLTSPAPQSRLLSADPLQAEAEQRLGRVAVDCGGCFSIASPEFRSGLDRRLLLRGLCSS